MRKGFVVTGWILGGFAAWFIVGSALAVWIGRAIDNAERMEDARHS